MTASQRRILVVVLVALPVAATFSACSEPEREPLVGIETIAENILQDIRYAGSDNFVGRPVVGYEAPRCMLTHEAASALARAQDAAVQKGLSLLVYDCFRPQRAVDDFVQWAAVPGDTLTKQRYYPFLPKDSLFALGYIAEKSGHTRGSTVDLTLARDGVPIDTGSPWDLFDPVSATADTTISAAAQANRAMLVDIMQGAGFRNYSAEWWHFTLIDEPFPATYFDQPLTRSEAP